jgi:cyclopropane fatty-acyl-phospholipid synthase-like methyltransferase
MCNQRHDVSESLDADERLRPFLPALLQDLWSLGFTPEHTLKLLERYGVAKRRGVSVLDLGCGKGAALIRLAQEFGWPGEGVDLVPEFIDDARRRAVESGVADRVRFDVADMARVAREGQPVDLILFGLDSDALGTLEESLTIVRSRLAAAGHVVLNTVWKRGQEPQPDAAMSEVETKDAVNAAGLVVVGEEILAPEWVRAQNRINTDHIRRRADELGQRHPEAQGWFAEYVLRQEEECSRLEEDLVCVVLLLALRV